MPGNRKKRGRDKEAVPLNHKQTEAERKALRLDQRNLKLDILDQKESLGQIGHGSFNALRTANNGQFNKVHHLREAVLDAENLLEITTAAGKQSKALALKQQAASVNKILAGLRRKWVDEDGGFDWVHFGTSAGSLVRAVPEFEFLCGSIERQEKKRVRKEREKKNNNDGVEEVRPEDVVTKDKKKIEATEKRLQLIGQKLTECTTPVDSSKQEPDYHCFFQFVMNPASHTQSVENIFDFSFLIKKGDAQLKINEQGMPVIRPMNATQNSENNKTPTQTVMSLTMAQWDEICETFECKSQGVEHRDDESYEPDYLGQWGK